MQNKLIEVLEARGVPYEASESGEWARIPCPHGGFRYVVRCRLADGYQAWCESGDHSRPDWYPTVEHAVDLSAEATAHKARQMAAVPAVHSPALA